MALDYAQTAALMQDVVFRDRTKVACLHYATYISGEDKSVPAHNTRMRWAQNTFASPEQSAVQVMPVLVMDDKVQTAGVDADGHSLITDPDLQSAVEASINSML